MEGGGLLDDCRRNDLAGPAPCREAVEDHEGVWGLHRLFELGFALEVVDALLAHCRGEVSEVVVERLVYGCDGSVGCGSEARAGE